MYLLKHARNHAYWYLLLAAMLLAIAGYYWLVWDTFANFVQSMDFSPRFMQDFADHYYPMSRQILQDPTPVKGYFYTSFFALLLAPIGALPLASAMAIWGAIQFTCLAALCIIPVRGFLASRPVAMILYAGLCATSYPVLNNINWGQVSILNTACVIAAFYAYSMGRRVSAGILLAFAAAIKFYPAFFLVYFILKRDLRTCAAFVLAALAFYVVLPAAILGFSSWLEFEKAIGVALSNTDWVARAVNSQYFVNVGRRWSAIFFNHIAHDTLVQILAIAGYAIALSCIAMVWFLQRREACEKHGLPMVMIFLSLPFLIKTSWPHYFVYLPVCQVAVFSYYAASFRASGLRGRALIGLPVLSMLFSSIFLFNLFPNWNVYNSYGMLFLANLLLLLAVYAAILVQPDRIE